MATVTGWHEPVRVDVSPADKQAALSEKSIGLDAASNPATFSPTEFSPRLRDAKTLNSFEVDFRGLYKKIGTGSYWFACLRRKGKLHSPTWF